MVLLRTTTRRALPLYRSSVKNDSPSRLSFRNIEKWGGEIYRTIPLTLQPPHSLARARSLAVALHGFRLPPPAVRRLHALARRLSITSPSTPLPHTLSANCPPAAHKSTKSTNFHTFLNFFSKFLSKKQYRGNYIYREICAAGPQSSTHNFPVGVQPYSTDFPTQIATLRLTAGWRRSRFR